MPLVYHKNGEKHRVFFFTGKVRGAAGPWVKCMLNLCGQAVRKKLGLFLLTQDAGGFFALIPLSCGGFSGRKKAFFVLFPKKAGAVYIKNAGGGNGEKRKAAWGQGFFTVSTEFSTALAGKVGCVWFPCGKVLCRLGEKKNFLAEFGRKSRKMHGSVNAEGKNRDSVPWGLHFYLRFSKIYDTMAPEIRKPGAAEGKQPLNPGALG